MCRSLVAYEIDEHNDREQCARDGDSGAGDSEKREHQVPAFLLEVSGDNGWVKTFNPARAMLDLVDLWSKADETVSQRRGIHGPLGTPLYRSQDYAVRVLRDLEQVLEREDALEEYQSLLDELHAFVYTPSQDWERVTASFNGAKRMALSALTRWLDTVPGATFSLTQAQVDALRGALQECLNIIDAEHAEGEKFFDYLRYVLTSCLELLEGESVDLLDLRSLSYEATALCIQATPRISDERRKAWLNEAGKISLAFGGNVFSGVAANVLGAGIVGLLGS